MKDFSIIPERKDKNYLKVKVAETIKLSDKVKIPSYLDQSYWWAYLHPRAVRVFDNMFAVNLILWGYYSFLSRRTAAMFQGESFKSVLQISCAYGNFCRRLAAIVLSKKEAHLDIADVAPIQLQATYEKLKHVRGVSFFQHDATEAFPQQYDGITLYFLLHELPLEAKKKVLKNALGALKKGGQLVITDFHPPSRFHPLRYIESLVFKFLEPFARDMWRDEVRAFCEDPEAFVWAKETFFGDFYQIVTVTKK